ncbi:MAG: Ppx/GppA family phosphatase [Pseudomonadota bacterium]
MTEVAEGDANPAGVGGLLADARRSFAAPRPGAGLISVIDIGSNSVRMVVFEGGLRSPSVVFNEKDMCGLGTNLLETGALSPEGRVATLATLRRFAAQAESMKVDGLAAVATAAMRDATDGRAFRDEIEAKTGIRAQITTGEEEARLAGSGVLFGNPDASGVTADLGGASMELARVGDGSVRSGLSTPLGPLRLSALAARGGDVDATIRGYLDTLSPELTEAVDTLYLVGGAWRALARVSMARSDYPLPVLHEYSLDRDTARSLALWVKNQSREKLLAFPGIASARAATMPYAARILPALLDRLSPRSVSISAFGLREGVVFDIMAPQIRLRDPLLAACEEQERRRARLPGFGAELGDFLLRLMPEEAGEERLIRALAYLADVNWRTHPDYRVTGCWETVTRANLSDLGHRGRALMGAALAMRYKRGRKAADPGGALRLVSEADQQRAMRIGLALRLGSALAGSSPGILGDVSVVRDKKAVSLFLSGRAREMAGAEVVKRLTQFARALDLEPMLSTTNGPGASA